MPLDDLPEFAPATATTGHSARLDLDGWNAHVLRWDPPAGVGDGSGDHPARVVLLHGGTAHAHAWEHLATALSERFEVVALDQRGHGRSAPTDRNGTKVLAADVGRLLDALGWDRASLVGHSLGGLAAYLFAAGHPERVEKLVLVDVGPEGSKQGLARILANVSGPSSFASFDEALETGRRWFPKADETLLRQRIEHNLVTGEDGTLSWRHSIARTDPAVVRQDHSDEEKWAAWKDLRVPTLLIQGADSDIVTDDLVASFIEANPAVTVARIDGAGHSVPLERPDALAEVTASFLTGAARA